MKTFKEFLSSIYEARERNPGKLIGGELYVHKDHEDRLPQEELEKAKSYLPQEHLNSYNIVKHNKKLGTFSFIHSPDFDTSDEPISGDSYKVTPEGRVSITKQKKDPQIYHHKWQWVSDNSNRFDVEASKRRSEAWKPITDKIKSEEDPSVMKKIGTKSYWDKMVLSRLNKP